MGINRIALARFGAPAVIAAWLASHTTPALAQAVAEIATAPAKVDAADTAWMLVSTALVLMMSIPGLALFYCGMVRKKNVLATMAQTIASVALGSLLWVAIGYSLTFTGEGAAIGTLERLMLHGMGMDTINTAADLAAVAIGATRDAAAAASNRGTPAARLRAIKTDIIKNLTDRRLSTETIAQRHGISARYVNMLFDGDATTFAEFVLFQRLNRVHRMLIDPRLSDRTISAVAFEAGFGDLSYFNRVFRRRYGATPSDVRASSHA